MILHDTSCCSQRVAIQPPCCKIVLCGRVNKSGMPFPLPVASLQPPFLLHIVVVFPASLHVKLSKIFVIHRNILKESGKYQGTIILTFLQMLAQKSAVTVKMIWGSDIFSIMK